MFVYMCALHMDEQKHTALIHVPMGGTWPVFRQRKHEGLDSVQAEDA